MRTSLRDLPDSTLRHDLKQLVRADRTTTAHLIAHIAEFIARKLYVEDGYASMYNYCVGELRMSEDVACGRIRAARAARRFPRIVEALAEGRIHLTGLALLAPHLTEGNVEELLGSALDKSKREIQLLIAERLPQPDLPTFVKSLGVLQVAQGQSTGLAGRAMEVATGPVDSSVPARMNVSARVTPIAPRRFSWQLTVSQETQDLLSQVQDLLGHDVAPGDLETVLKFALQAAKERLEKRKFAATEHPRAGRRRANPESRHVPAEVRRAVWERDGAQCSFTSDAGHRCQERKDLEFDHIDPYARGGEATVSGIRLLCRAHNQLEAERTYGAEFMRYKRIAAGEARVAAKAQAAGKARMAVREHPQLARKFLERAKSTETCCTPGKGAESRASNEQETARHRQPGRGDWTMSRH